MLFPSALFERRNRMPLRNSLHSRYLTHPIHQLLGLSLIFVVWATGVIISVHSSNIDVVPAPTSIKSSIAPFMPQLQCITPPPGMVSWWPGDGNEKDVVSGNNATFVGAVTFD